jgi:hypothetical protein
VRRNCRRDRSPLLLPQEIQAILDGCAVYDVATGEWVGNLRDRLLFALLAESGMPAARRGPAVDPPGPGYPPPRVLARPAAAARR